jgi:hypothetical protein
MRGLARDEPVEPHRFKGCMAVDQNQIRAPRSARLYGSDLQNAFVFPKSVIHIALVESRLWDPLAPNPPIVPSTATHAQRYF